MFRVQSHGGGPFPVVVACPVIGWDPGLWLPAPTRGHVVHSPMTPRVAPQQAPGPEDQSLDGAVNADCLQRVGGAAGRVAAPGAKGRGNVSLVGDDGRGGECDKHSPPPTTVIARSICATLAPSRDQDGYRVPWRARRGPWRMPSQRAWSPRVGRRRVRA